MSLLTMLRVAGWRFHFILLLLLLVTGVSVAQMQPPTEVRPGQPFNQVAGTILVREDFLWGTNATQDLAGGTRVFGQWWGSGNFGGPTLDLGANGVVIIAGNGANRGTLTLTGANVTGAGTAGYIGRFPGSLSMEWRWSQATATAGTRRCGITNATFAATPTAGTWIEYTAGGNYTYRIREGSTDFLNSIGNVASFSASVQTSSLNMDTMKMVINYVTGDTTVTVNRQTSYSGIVTPQLGCGGSGQPCVFMCDGGSTTSGVGLYLDYVELSWNRDNLN